MLVSSYPSITEYKIRSSGLTANNENIPHTVKQARKETTLSMLSKDLTESHSVKSPRDNYEQQKSVKTQIKSD